MNKSVNNKLIANEILLNTQVDRDQELLPITKTKLITGSKSQKHYHENKKGSASKKIRELINTGLNSHGFELAIQGVNDLDGIVSEILGNAEDHSIFDTWYTYGNLFETDSLRGKKDEFVGEINLAFLNFGSSIYEGFEGTKMENSNCYDQMNDLASNILAKNNKDFDKQSLFTLYALQQGFSRLNYKEESRGTGSVRIINSFLNLGDFQDSSKQYIPQLSIYSGKTFFKCDNTYKAYEIDGGYYISLNSSNNLLDEPSNTHLQKLNYNFPGTFLVVKLYLNETHLRSKVKNNGN